MEDQNKCNNFSRLYTARWNIHLGREANVMSPRTDDQSHRISPPTHCKVNVKHKTYYEKIWEKIKSVKWLSGSGPLYLQKLLDNILHCYNPNSFFLFWKLREWIAVYLQDIWVHVFCPLLAPRSTPVWIICTVGKALPLLEWSLAL